MNIVEIYTSQTCTYCHKAKKLLQMLKLEFTEHDVSNSFDKMCEEFSQKYNKSISTIPQIIINGKYIGGYDELETIYKSGKLKEIIE